MTGTVILVDDDPVFRESLEQSFELADLPVQSYAQPMSVLGNITEDTVGVIVSDVRMPKLNGEQLLSRIKEIDAEVPVILLTGHGDVPMAVRSLQAGAFSFHEKPVDAQTLVQDCRRALELREAVVSQRRLSRELQGRDRLFMQVLGSSPKIQGLRRQLSALGATDADVLITHDRRFLANVCRSIAELDRGNLTVWQGTYEGFLRHRDQALEAWARSLEIDPSQRAIVDLVTRYRNI